MSAETITMVGIRSIQETPENWEIYNEGSDDALEELYQSVVANGILEPLTISADNFILSGHRRHKAARHAVFKGIKKLSQVPVIVAKDIEIGPMPREERIKVLIQHNRGTRVKTSSESILEAMAAVDPAQAINAAQARKSHVFTKVKSSKCEVIEGEGKSRRTNPLKQRAEFLAAVTEILEDLESRRMIPISARHIHYRLLAGKVRTSAGKAGHPYGSKGTDHKLLSKLLTDARSAGLIEDDWLSDETRPAFSASYHDSIGAYVAEETKGLFQGFFSNIHRDQPAHVEIIIEKSTLYPLLKSQVAGELRIPITSARGYLSYPAACSIRNRFEASGKDQLCIVYVSDHDPEGIDMPKSFTKYFWEDHNIDPTVIRAGITRAQIEKYNLRHDAIAKESSSRYESYIKEHGNAVWELDSMDPEILVREVKQACLACLNESELNAAFEREKEDDIHLARMQAAVVEFISKNPNAFKLP